ncbi:MAG TPA: helical backbone metal receptor, partial [Myxococcota bacterium]|nr:helical backbone metal receptor [Myxococcota bacterium]
ALGAHPSVSVGGSRRETLCELGIEVLELESITLDEIFGSLQALGERVGRSEAAAQRIAEIRGTWREVAREAAQRPRRSALFVVQRDPLFVVGGRSYLDAMLDAAGLDNAAAKYSEAYPRVSLEWLIASAPEVIIDSSADPVAAADYWARWPSIPAVAAQRVVSVPQSLTTLPGPDLDRSLRTIVAALRGADAAAAAGDGTAPQ